MTTRLLINEPPLQVLPSLAVKIGLNEALVVQQIHYWLQKSDHHVDDRFWIYNTFEDWQEAFPFWSIRTIKRLFAGLQEQGILLRAEFNGSKWDHTSWWTLDYNELCMESSETSDTSDSDTLSLSECQDVTIDDENMAPPDSDTLSLSYIGTERSTERSNIDRAQAAQIRVQVMNRLQEDYGAVNQTLSKMHQRLATLHGYDPWLGGYERAPRSKRHIESYVEKCIFSHIDGLNGNRPNRFELSDFNRSYQNGTDPEYTAAELAEIEQFKQYQRNLKTTQATLSESGNGRL